MGTYIENMITIFRLY